MYMFIVIYKEKNEQRFYWERELILLFEENMQTKMAFEVEKPGMA